jgi:hypothetical protein
MRIQLLDAPRFFAAAASPTAATAAAISRAGRASHISGGPNALRRRRRHEVDGGRMGFLPLLARALALLIARKGRLSGTLGR